MSHCPGGKVAPEAMCEMMCDLSPGKLFPFAWLLFTEILIFWGAFRDTPGLDALLFAQLVLNF